MGEIIEMGIDFELLKEVVADFDPCMNDYLYVFDLDHDIYTISEHAVERFNLKSSTFTNVVEEHANFVHKDDLAMLQYDLDEMIAGVKDQHDLRYRWIGKDGKPIWIHCKGRIIRGDHPIMIGCINEVGAKYSGDNMTGLLNEAAFRDYVNSMETIPNGFVLRIGIDEFKQVNERFGTAVGDVVLRELADCINSCIEKDQKVFRMLADEFIVADVKGRSVIDAILLYRRIRVAVDECLMKQNYQMVYTISAGIITDKQASPSDKELVNADWLSMRSEFALNMAKKNGKNQAYVFETEEYDKFLRGRKLLGDVRKAINHDFKGFSLHYQPLVSSKDHNFIIGAEALLRFQNEEGENISPAELVPVLEESGLIIPVGKWVMKTAFEQCKKFQESDPAFHVSVNVSFVQLQKSPIFHDIMGAIEDAKLAPESVVIEMTESGIWDNTSLQDVWRKLKDVGCKIAIDDFGTGYSNLHSISELKPNIVKIDHSFTHKAIENLYEYELMGYIIHMVQSVDAEIVIEGIETDDDLKKINRLRPDYIQGYFYSKPLPAEEFLSKFLAS